MSIDLNLALWATSLLAGLLSTIAYLPYARDTWRGITQPQRASWFIWSLLSSIALAGQIFEGAGSALWFAAMQCGGTVLIFGLSLWFGKGALLVQGDGRILCLAGVGLLTWALTETAAYTLALTISVSLIAGSATVAKVYRAPASETASTWALSCAAGLLAMIATGAMDPVFLAYPAYIFGLSGAILSSMALGRLKQRTAPKVMTIVPFIQVVKDIRRPTRRSTDLFPAE